LHYFGTSLKMKLQSPPVNIPVDCLKMNCQPRVISRQTSRNGLRRPFEFELFFNVLIDHRIFQSRNALYHTHMCVLNRDSKHRWAGYFAGTPGKAWCGIASVPELLSETAALALSGQITIPALQDLTVYTFSDVSPPRILV